MLIYPQIDPVMLQLGPVAVHWYGMMYLLAFAAFVLLGRRRAIQHPAMGWDAQQIDDLLFYGVLGVILGGRLGEVFFYQPAYFWQHPSEIIAIWKGGMSFHGGFLGVLVALAWFAKKTGRSFLQVGDFVAPLVPLGLAFGRIGNFINGELWGRVADPALPWAMVFPHVDALPRHPSQLYQAMGEGLLFFIVLWLYAQKPRATGAVSAVFLIGYGGFRFIAEFFRNPDAGFLGYLPLGLSTAQWLCVPMIAIGVWLLWRSSSAHAAR
ncbi:MAG: prolipoprotein diacylglyceryl transferase [Betaproteobacteria bacterium]|nr:MAG: prolipoprotein diacylglyceryl transferase [Betaproteobacteria bacterium]